MYTQASWSQNLESDGAQVDLEEYAIYMKKAMMHLQILPKSCESVPWDAAVLATVDVLAFVAGMPRKLVSMARHKGTCIARSLGCESNRYEQTPTCTLGKWFCHEKWLEDLGRQLEDCRAVHEQPYLGR